MASQKALKSVNRGSSNAVWNAYLKSKGFTREIVSNDCPECYTINDFCREVYASTQNEQERNIYFNMLDKLNKR